MQEIELFTRLYNLYLEGRLASVWDEEKGGMENDMELDEIMDELVELLPEELTGPEAAHRMREMPEEVKDAAIEAAGDKVIDMRKHFRQQMSLNGGALGLTRRAVRAIEEGNSADFDEAMNLMKQLVAEENNEKA